MDDNMKRDQDIDNFLEDQEFSGSQADYGNINDLNILDEYQNMDFNTPPPVVDNNERVDINDNNISGDINSPPVNNKPDDYLDDNKPEHVSPDDIPELSEDDESYSIPDGPILTPPEKFNLETLQKEAYQNEFSSETSSKVQDGEEIKYITLRFLEDKIPEIIKDENRADRLIQSVRDNSEDLYGRKAIELGVLNNIVTESHQYDPKMDKHFSPDASAATNVSDPKEVEQNIKNTSKTQEKEDEAIDKRMGNDAYSRMGKDEAIGRRLGDMVSGLASQAIGPPASKAFQGGKKLFSTNKTPSPRYTLEAGKDMLKQTYEDTVKLRDDMINYRDSGGDDPAVRHKIQKDMKKLGDLYENNKDVLKDKKLYNSDEDIKNIKKRITETSDLAESLYKDGKLDKDSSLSFMDKAKKAVKEIVKAFQKVFKKMTGQGPSPS